MDLVNGTPRSPYESMHGIVFLPRAIDKVRAEIAGKLGDYISRTFFSGMLLEFLGIEPQDFVDAVAARDCDEEVWAWIKARMTPRSATEIMAFNHEMMTRTPDDDTTRERYWQFMADIGQSHRTDLTRQFDRLDLDEDRDIPLGGPAVSPRPQMHARSFPSRSRLLSLLTTLPSPLPLCRPGGHMRGPSGHIWGNRRE